MSAALAGLTGVSGVFVYAGFKLKMDGIAEAYQEDVIELAYLQDGDVTLSDVLQGMRNLETNVRADKLVTNSELLNYVDGPNAYQIASIVMLCVIGFFLLWAFYRKFVQCEQSA
jgi:hypothetical protein